MSRQRALRVRQEGSQEEGGAFGMELGQIQLFLPLSGRGWRVLPTQGRTLGLTARGHWAWGHRGSPSAPARVGHVPTLACF